MGGEREREGGGLYMGVHGAGGGGLCTACIACTENCTYSGYCSSCIA